MNFNVKFYREILILTLIHFNLNDYLIFSLILWIT